MSTKTLSPGMCNFPINITEEERAILSKLAFNEDRSAGSLVRSLILEGMKAKYPEMAEQVRQIRISHRMMAGAAMLCVGLVTVWVSMNEGLNIRRTPQNVRVVRRGGRNELEA